MTPERWGRLKEIFAAALEREPLERDRFVAQSFEGDSELLHQARRLLASHDDAKSFLSDPAITSSACRGEPSQLFAPEQIVAGRFRIVRFIARGGMGEVYEAEDLALSTTVALKTIQARITGDNALDLFKREILSARRVTHPNVCRIYDIAEHIDGINAPVSLLTMELLEGPTLSRHFKDHGPFSRSEALPLIQQICAGLQAAHDAGVIHRDFKSGNVILTRESHGWRPVITDFGLARVAGSGPEPHGAHAGTPGYMAPEQMEGGPATPATDVFALGVVIGRMIGYARPAGARGSSAPPELPEAVDDRKNFGPWKRVIGRCMEQDAAKRYQRPADVAAALWRSSVLWPRSVIALAAGLALVLALLWLVNRRPVFKQMVDRQVWAEFVFNYGSVSTDGRYLAFTNHGTGDLAIRDLHTGMNRFLTHKPGGWNGSRDNAANALVSPDSRQVAYRWNTGTTTSDLRMVTLMGSEASLPRILLRSEESRSVQPFAWTPDSQNVLVARVLRDNRIQLAWVSAADGSVRVLKWLESMPVRASLSPDGRYVAYDGLEDPKGVQRDIFVVAADGSRETVAVQNPANDFGGIWSSDGSQILFRSDRTGNLSLWTVRIDHGKPAGSEELVKTEFGRSLTPLGITRSGAFYYSSSGNRNNIFVAEVNGDMIAAGPPVLAAEQFVNSNFNPSWSPDGQALAYISQRGVDGPSALVVQSGKPRQSRVVPVEIGLYVDTPLLWFPDGRSVLIAATEPPKDAVRTNGLYRVNLASGAAQLVHRPAVAYYHFLREGKTVLYGITDPATKQWGGQLNRFDIDSGRLTIFKRTEAKDLLFTSLAVSPDGNQVAYILRNDKTHESSLEVMPASGGQPRELFRGRAGGFAERAGIAWSPDQRYLLFVRGVNAQNAVDVSIWRVSVRGGEIENTGITVQGAPDDSVLAFPSVHPDGRHIAYTRREPFMEVRVMENFLPKAAAR